MADAATIGEQTDAVLEELRHGTPTRKIKARFMAEWGVSEGTVKNRMYAARRKYGKISEPEQEYERGKSRSQVDAVFSAAYADGNWAACLKAIELRAKLLGLNAPDVHEFNVPRAWLGVFDDFGIRIPGDGKNGTRGGEDAPEVRH